MPDSVCLKRAWDAIRVLYGYASLSATRDYPPGEAKYADDDFAESRVYDPSIKKFYPPECYSLLGDVPSKIIFDEKTLPGKTPKLYIDVKKGIGHCYLWIPTDCFTDRKGDIAPAVYEKTIKVWDRATKNVDFDVPVETSRDRKQAARSRATRSKLPKQAKHYLQKSSSFTKKNRVSQAPRRRAHFENLIQRRTDQVRQSS